ncbi:MAG: cysteine hydrolase [Desulfobacterales bacterium]|nr:cysteine hydrolase [Desulfobacterales bacterium]
MAKKALIVIDMLNDFIDEKGVLFCGADARDKISFIKQRIQAYRDNDDLVIYMTDSHDEDDKEFDKFQKHAVTGTWGNEIIRELTPGPMDKVIPKKRYSSFYGTGLEKVLKDSNIKAAEVVGVCTSICVMDTVGDLVNRDYPVTVPVKGVADFDPEAHEFALKRMKQIYGANVR